MFLTEKTFVKSTSHFKSGDYVVITNPLGEKFTEENWKKEDHQANYLVVNRNTLAIEFAIDQLPSAIEIAKRMNSDLQGPEVPKEVIEVPRMN